MTTRDGVLGRETTYVVRIWSVQKIASKRPSPGKAASNYRLRWIVAGKRRSENFTTAALAESQRAALLTAARQGEAFDVATGRPVSWLPAPEPAVVLHSWWDWALTYVDLKWPTLAPNSRRSIAEALTSITSAILITGDGRPDAAQLRRAMMQWAFIAPRRSAGGPPAELSETVAWLSRSTPDLSVLTDPAAARSVLNALARKLDGSPAAATTIARKRAVFFNAMELAVEHQLLDANPLAHVRWKAPKAAEAIDPACVVNPVQARALLVAVGQVGDGSRDLSRPADRSSKSRGPKQTSTRRREPKGGPLVAFFGCLYYAGMRPGEALALVESNLQLPDKDDEWGWLRLSGSDPEVTTAWTDTGRRETRQLKHRARGEVRPVPCAPPLVTLLRQHLTTYGVGPEGRLFRGVRGGPVKESLYTEVWQAARQRALTRSEAVSTLVARPYDLRHSCVSTWLAAGVDSTQIAAWVGHSVAVLHRVYAHVLPGRDEVAQRRIDDMLRRTASEGRSGSRQIEGSGQRGSGRSIDQAPLPTTTRPQPC